MDSLQLHLNGQSAIPSLLLLAMTPAQWLVSEYNLRKQMPRNFQAPSVTSLREKKNVTHHGP